MSGRLEITASKPQVEIGASEGDIDAHTPVALSARVLGTANRAARRAGTAPQFSLNRYRHLASAVRARI
jgi:hypothetical protein